MVDDAGAIVRFCDPNCTSPTASYLVTWNGHGDALAAWKIDPTTGTLTLANSYIYSSWGAPTTGTHNSIADLGFRFLYVGRHDVQWDNFSGLGLFYMHARHYAPAIGRFLQPDPTRLEANTFAYAGNNPISWTDPAGTALLQYVESGGSWGGFGTAAIAIGIYATVSVVTWCVAYCHQYIPWPRPNTVPVHRPVGPLPGNRDCGWCGLILLSHANDLPKTGDRTYEPPKSGHGEAVRARGGGFLDKWGNRWEWARPGARHGGDHWDVQHPDGKHTNVTPGPKGKVIGRDNFPNRR